ncbi:glycosyltransferase family 2 protein [Vibrio cyclitrophicus]|uniref:glycosyltransferase family 2 protein n=1 Tax=Vibrio cyclitrophicus TaxID=47951 RepID=UPI003999CC71
MKNKVSVLIPVYGVEAYLDKFLDSLCQQDLRESEFIIVNDGSPDCSDEIIGKYLSKDERFIYINKPKNEGLYKARQDAFDIATGEYVINLDSDDFICPNFLSSMYNLAKKELLDIVVSNVALIDEQGNDLPNSKSKIKNDDLVFNCSNINNLISIPYATWCRMYKRNLLVETDYRYEKGELYLTNYHFLDGVNSGISSKSTYFYRIRNNSMSSVANSSEKLQNKFSEITIKKFNKEISSMKIAPSLLGYYNLFNNLAFLKLNFISCIHGFDVNRYKRLKSIIYQEFPVPITKKIFNLTSMPKELAAFSILDFLKLAPILLYIKSNKKIN